MSIDGKTLKVFQDVARREVERHRETLIGLTASPPELRDFDGVLEFVCDVRVGARQEQGLVKDVLIAQWAVGAITDINIPVLMERSEAGRLTIIARTQIRLPDITRIAYSYGALDVVFAANLRQLEDGSWVDGYGFPAQDPTGEVAIREDWQWQQSSGLDEEIPEDLSNTNVAGWVLQ